MDAIFENYELFLKEHESDFSNPNDVMRMLNDQGMYRSYVDSLTEGLSPVSKANVVNVLNRERMMILQEAANVSASSFVSGWTVMSFPILVDIYAEPIISELMNVYPIDKPVISIPRIRIKAQTKSYDGSKLEESYIPTATKMIRAGLMEVAVSPGISNNIFVTTGLNPDHMKMNRRYTLMTKVTVKELSPTDGTTVLATHNVDVNFRPDNRNQIATGFSFTDSHGEVVDASVTGNVNYEKGIIQFQVIFGGGSGSIYECAYATFSLRFTPVATIKFSGILQ